MSKGMGTVLIAVLCVASLGLAGATLVTPDAGLAEGLGGETDPPVADAFGDGFPEASDDDADSENETDGDSGENETDGDREETGGEDGHETDGAGTADDDEFMDNETVAGDSGGAETPSDEDEDDPGEPGDRGDAEEEDSKEDSEPESEADSRDTPEEGDPESDPETEDSLEEGGETDDDRESEGDAEDSETEGDKTEADGGTASGGYPEESEVGGPLELTEREELIVKAPNPSLWRLGAYTTYTGSGWSRDAGAPERVTGPIRTNGDDNPTPQYEIEVTTRRAFGSLVAAWRPAFAGADRDIYVDDNKGLTVEESFNAGDSYSTVTYGPPSRQAAAAASGGSYPADIEERYTQLPADTPERLEEKTNDITADANTPYEAATAVDAWLKESKEYTLDASHDTSNDVATEFVFEMDAGYCQYFATAMTAMLRTEGIPTRYVTGYGAGEQIDDDEYLLRGKHAHAWVEVYFEGVGWVTFDPTPSDGRLDAERDEQRLNEPGDVDGDETDEEDNGSEEKETQEKTTDEEGTDDEDEAAEARPIEVTFDSEPVPGDTITVTVTQDDAPLSRAVVEFNGKRIGVTDADGQTTGEVPYVAELNVTVRTGDDTQQRQRRYTNRGMNGGSSIATSNTDQSAAWSKPPTTTLRPQRLANSESDASDRTGERLSDTRMFRSPVHGDTHRSQGHNTTAERFRSTTELDEAWLPAALRWQPTIRSKSAVEKSSDETTVTVNLPTNISVSVPDDPVPGTEMEVRAHVDGVPVTDARVEVANTTARTGADGVATLPVPFQQEVGVTVTRGEASGNASLLVLYELVLETPEEVAAGTDTDFRVTVSDEPVTNATVTVDNESTTTDDDGIATVPFPFEETATVTAERGEFADERTITAATDLSLAVEGRVAPGFAMSVTATNDGAPVADVPITAGGTEYGTTGADGEATFRLLEATPSVSIVAKRGTISESAGPYALWPYWLSYVGVAVGIALVAAWRSGRVGSPKSTLSGVLIRVYGLVKWLDHTVRRAALWLVEATVGVVGFLRATAECLRRLAVVASRDLTDAMCRLLRWLGTHITSTGLWLLGIVALLRDPTAWKDMGRWLLGLPGWSVAAVRGLVASETHADGSTGDSLTMSTADFKESEEAEVDDLEQILESWEQLERSAGRQPDWTPTEVAERARRRGYPDDAVDQLTSVFQQIRYGKRPPTPERAAAAIEAAETLTGGDD